MRPCRRALVGAVLLGSIAAGADAQTTGTVVGRVTDAETGGPLAGVEIAVVSMALRTVTTEAGRFVLVAVPAGERSLQARLLGYQPLTLDGVQVRAGRIVDVDIALRSAPVAVEGVTVQVDRVRLIEPDVSASRELVIGRELRELPVDAVEKAIELSPGVSDGHFRGGRVGQESYVVDGLELKNRLEASTQGFGIEFSPTSLEEVEVVTGGFGAEYGSALSGVVSYATRRGHPEQWEGRATLLSDHWAPERLLRGFTGLTLSAGGPAPLLGRGATVFADVLVQGLLDADPRARGLTCLRAGDVNGRLATELDALIREPAAAHLHCPYTPAMLPNQQGDKVIGFLRLDRPLTGSSTLMASVLRNRTQRQLYTPEFKYNRDYQLGQRSVGTLVNVGIDWARHVQGRAYHVTARGAVMRLDRQLGVVDPWTFRDRLRVAGFGPAGFRILGEDFVRRPIEEQLAEGAAVPGYQVPGGATGSPFGPAGEGIFFTEGTPGIANWTRSEFAGGDLVGELVTSAGHSLRAGGATRFYHVESYERVLAFVPGSAPNYARFYPATVQGFVEARLAASDDVAVRLGVRTEAFRSGLVFRRDRFDFLAPAVETGWKLSLMPRIGVTGPVPHTDGRTAFRFNYGRVAQPPDFQYFLDTTIGDSLRTDIRRQGNPNMGFERGASYELGLSQIVADNIGMGLTLFAKELTNLVTGSVRLSGIEEGQFSTGDFGTVRGLELTARGRWPGLLVRVGYALQKATGVASGTSNDSIADADAPREEFPLAFDRRHSADFALFAGRAAGSAGQRWGAAITTSVRSGYPLDRRLLESGGAAEVPVAARLPWTGSIDGRISYDFGSPPLCTRCAWRVVADARNLLGRENVIALRRDTGGVAPSVEEVLAVAGSRELTEPIPRESHRYSALIDLDADGRIAAAEFRRARLAAALDRYDPSLFYGEPRQIRLGLEVRF